MAQLRCLNPTFIIYVYQTLSKEVISNKKFINLEIIGEKDKNIKKKIIFIFQKSIKIFAIW